MTSPVPVIIYFNNFCAYKQERMTGIWGPKVVNFLWLSSLGFCATMQHKFDFAAEGLIELRASKLSLWKEESSMSVSSTLRQGTTEHVWARPQCPPEQKSRRNWGLPPQFGTIKNRIDSPQHWDAQMCRQAWNYTGWCVCNFLKNFLAKKETIWDAHGHLDLWHRKEAI